jgi:hypothetical protein
VGLSIELQQASRICPESKKACTKNAPLTPPLQKNKLEWKCAQLSFRKTFFFKIWQFFFLEVYVKRNIPLFFFSFSHLCEIWLVALSEFSPRIWFFIGQNNGANFWEIVVL